MLVARRPDGAIAGAIALVFYSVPAGPRARIEDLDDSRNHRGLGLGKALRLHTLDVARQQHGHVLEQTSNPSRMEASRLYLALGFRHWIDENVHRMALDRPQGPAGSA